MLEKRESNLCPVCGKQMTAGGGSMTSWIFGRASCRCRNRPAPRADKGASAREALSTRLNANDKKQLTFGESYEVLDLIGEGGMATVYKVRSRADGQLFAIKMLKPELAREPGAVMRFKQEVKAASKLTHPSLVATYELGETRDGIPYFVMDYVDGCNLSALISQDGKLSLERALSIFISLCEAIEHAHTKGIVHRDLKPSNVLVTAQGLVKVVDFGIAKVLLTATTGSTASLTQTGEVFGSPLYMSPEQCMGETSDERSDIYSLGCVMYEMLVGTPPFQGANPIKIIFGHLNETPRRIDRNVAEAEKAQLAGLESIVLRCLEKKPGDRYDSVQQLLTDLNNVKDGKPPAIAKKSPKRRRHALKVAAVAAGLAGIAATSYLSISSMNNNQPTTHTAQTMAESTDKSKNSEAMKKLLASFSNEIRAHPDEDYWYIMRGTTYREAGDLVNALMDFTMAISKNPKNAKAYRERGWTYAKMENWKKAAEDNSTAIELDPRYADAYIGRARDYLELGDYQRALADSTRAIELNPQNHMAFLNRASVLYNLKRYKESMVDCDKTIELNPTEPHPRILRSRVAEKLGNYKKAIDDLSFYLSKEPNEVPRLIERAFMFNLAKDYESAIKDADRAKQLDPKHLGGYIARAQALNGLGKTNEAFEEFDRGQAVDPNNSEIPKLRGDIYARRGEREKALASYDMALKLWPGYKEASDAKSAVLQSSQR